MNLKAGVSTYERTNYNHTAFNWYLWSTSSSNTGKSTNLQNQLNSLYTEIIYLRNQYFEPNQNYEIRVWYTNYYGVNITGSYSFVSPSTIDQNTLYNIQDNNC